MVPLVPVAGEGELLGLVVLPLDELPPMVPAPEELPPMVLELDGLASGVVLEPLPMEPLPIELEPVPMELEPVPMELEPVPMELEPVPIELEPVPIELESAPGVVEPLPIELLPVESGVVLPAPVLPAVPDAPELPMLLLSVEDEGMLEEGEDGLVAEGLVAEGAGADGLVLVAPVPMPVAALELPAPVLEP